MVTATNLVFEVQIQSQRRDVAQRVLVGLVVVVCVVGRSEKFSYGMVRSRKPLQTVPLHNTAITVPLLSTCTIQHRYTAFDSIPRPPIESIDNLTSTNEQLRASNEQRVNIRPLLTPRAIARGACGHSPPYCRTNWQPDHKIWFSSSPLNGVVTLREGLATGA